MKKRMHSLGLAFARGVLTVALVCLALLVAGCGSGATEEVASQAQDEQSQEQEAAFKGRKKRDASELKKFVDEAHEVLVSRQSANPKDTNESELATSQNGAFKAANEAYRAGKYDNAQKGYETILGEYPEHYGANVNLTLALLQQQKNDEALVQSLVCVGMYPSEAGPLLNLQTAAVACGFSAEDALVEAAAEMLATLKEKADAPQGMTAEQQYNRLWDTIEIALYDVAQGKATDGDYVYKSLLADVDELAKGELASDKDAQALRAYLVAVGTQLGLAGDANAKTDASAKDEEKDKKDAAKDEEKEADKAKEQAASKAEQTVDLSTVQAHAGLPYVVADDETCTIVFTGYHMAADSPVAEFEFVNNSGDTLSFSGTGEVTGNGKEIQNLSAAWPAVDPGEQESAWGSFFATEGGETVSVLEGDLTSLSCAIKVRKTKGTVSDSLATYPLKWEADAAKVAKKTDTTILENEGGVTMRVTGILPVSDGIVAIEYWGSYKGEGKALVDGSDWKANGKDVVLLGAGSPLGTGTAGHHYLLFHAASADDLRDEAIESLAGTLTIRDADGKELISKQVSL